MNREDAIEYIISEFSKLIAQVGLEASDDVGGFFYTINSAARELSVDPDDYDDFVIDVASDDEFQALLDYYALQRIARAAAAMVDVTSGATGTSKSRSQLSVQISDLLITAQRRVESLGFVVLRAWSGGEINLDFIEAKPETEFG
jgi:hypothetical protein